jgi:large subunit ribosomal protein L25
MADIVLNVEVRDRAGTGAARAVRREGKVPGVLYGGDKDPVGIAVSSNAFRKALYTGKLLGHLVTLKYGDETQPVIAKDVQFHPVTDEPMHFDLYRVDEHQEIRISVAVHFRNEELSPGMKRGGALNINLHELDVLAMADKIPEELLGDLTGLDIGDAIRASDIPLPPGVKHAVRDPENTVVASVAPSSAMQAEAAEAAEAAAAAAEAGEEGEAEAEAPAAEAQPEGEGEPEG